MTLIQNYLETYFQSRSKFIMLKVITLSDTRCPKSQGRSATPSGESPTS